MKRKCLVCLCGWLFSIILISSTQAMQFAVISDVRVAALDKALEFIKSQGIDLILLPGDFCYDGQAYYPHFEKFGFQTRVEKSPDMQNIYFTLGNHDAPPAGDIRSRQLSPPGIQPTVLRLRHWARFSPLTGTIAIL